MVRDFVLGALGTAALLGVGGLAWYWVETLKEKWRL